MLSSSTETRSFDTETSRLNTSIYGQIDCSDCGGGGGSSSSSSSSSSSTIVIFRSSLQSCATSIYTVCQKTSPSLHYF